MYYIEKEKCGYSKVQGLGILKKFQANESSPYQSQNRTPTWSFSPFILVGESKKTIFLSFLSHTRAVRDVVIKKIGPMQAHVCTIEVHGWRPLLLL